MARGAVIAAASLGLFGERARHFASEISAREVRSRGMGVTYGGIFSAPVVATGEAAALLAGAINRPQQIKAEGQARSQEIEAQAQATAVSADQARQDQALKFSEQLQAEAAKRQDEEAQAALSDLSSAIDKLQKDASSVFASAKLLDASDPSSAAAAKAATDVVTQLLQAAQSSFPGPGASPYDVRILIQRIRLADSQVADLDQEIVTVAAKAKAAEAAAISSSLETPLSALGQPKPAGMGAATDLVGGVFGGLFQAIGQIGNSIPAIEAASGLKSAQQYAGVQAQLKSQDLQNQAILNQAQLVAAQGTATSSSVAAWAPWAAIGLGGVALATAVAVAAKSKQPAPKRRPA